MKTLEQAKQELRQSLKDGAICPCCNRLVKMYKRKPSSTAAMGLIALYRLTTTGKGAWFHISAIQGKSGGGDFAKLRYFGLIEEAENTDGLKRTSGYWRITPKGRQFVKGWAKVPCYVQVYNGRVYGESEETITIFQALGNRFNYDELMGGRDET